MSSPVSLSSSAESARVLAGAVSSRGRLVVCPMRPAKSGLALRSSRVSMRKSCDEAELTFSAIYYAEKQQFVGLAGKPGSVNDFNALAEKRGKPNTKLAGIRT